jgi:hypothetical protein
MGLAGVPSDVIKFTFSADDRFTWFHGIEVLDHGWSDRFLAQRWGWWQAPFSRSTKINERID